MTNDRCEYSDLPNDQCEHCHPNRPGNGFTLPTYGVALLPPLPGKNTKLSTAMKALLGLDATPIHMAQCHDLHEFLGQLAWPIANQQRFEISQVNTDGTVTRIGSNHKTAHPPLITQLWEAANQGKHDDLGGRPGYASKPTARLDAIDAVARIDDEAARWIRNLGEDDPGTTLACLRHLNGLAAGVDNCRKKPHTDCCTYHAIERDTRSWWVQARVLTGWDSPAWRPDSSCPLCGTRGGLRIKLVSKTGFCVDCHEVWDETSIGLLADHIRDEADDEKPRLVEPPEICQCAWPQDMMVGRMGLCPECGSRYCLKALDQIIVKLRRRVS